ncbi:MAG TPA: hypothetical protein VGN52_01070 [Burkholderiales bacterium]|jgi:hypothetical protein
MRAELLDPLHGDTDLKETVLLAKEIYRLFEAGVDYSEELDEVAQTVGRTTSSFDVHSAFGSVSPETFARLILIGRKSVPSDLNHAEMLERVERVCHANGSESDITYWIDCLRVNTGDKRISDLIFWPGEYFADGDNSRELTPVGILTTAVR